MKLIQSVVVTTVLFALSGGSSIAADLIGQASVIDGDTLEIHGSRIRLFGIDAPESNQLCRDAESDLYRCGQKVANALYEFIAHRPVECVEVDRDRYGRSVAVCTVDNVDIADWIVRSGLALDWPQYSKGSYVSSQDEARHHQRGLWAGSFVEPWRFRACMRSGGRPTPCSDEAR
ncbi:thermonuclease family protein [Bradyrhizobium sp. UFLA05-112]